MSEYIDKKALLDEICRDNCERSYDGTCHNCRMTETIADFPAADVQPVVHGEWINVYGNFSTAECVVCKSQFEVTFGEESNGALWDGFCQFYRYCPYCGARMDGE